MHNASKSYILSLLDAAPLKKKSCVSAVSPILACLELLSVLLGEGPLYNVAEGTKKTLHLHNILIQIQQYSRGKVIVSLL